MAARTAVWQASTDRRALFGALTGGAREAPKLACRLAGMIEEQLICGDRLVGDMLGSEQNLAEQFGVCRVVMRETARILQAHGTARTRRGLNGGLILSRPTPEHAIGSALCYVLYYLRDVSHAIDAARIVGLVEEDETDQQTGECRSDTRLLVEFLRALVEQATAEIGALAANRASKGHAPGSGPSIRTRAMQVTHQLMHDARDSHLPHNRLGSELDLSERYKVDRGVLRQAIRILETAGSIAALAGRGNGIMLCEPQMAPACRLAHCFFSTHQASAGSAMRVSMHLAAHMAAMAAARVSRSAVERMAHALATLRSAGDQHHAAAVLAAENSQFEGLANPLLMFLLTAVNSYPVWRIGDPGYHWRNRDAYVASTAAVMEAIARGDPIAAAQAQRSKSTLLGTARAQPI